MKLYECRNKACSLGTAGAPGHFTGGIMAGQVQLLTGDPLEVIEEKGEYGDGYCPNCGHKGTALKEKH
jgi:hypothetical protein